MIEIKTTGDGFNINIKANRSELIAFLPTLTREAIQKVAADDLSDALLLHHLVNKAAVDAVNDVVEAEAAKPRGLSS